MSGTCQDWNGQPGVPGGRLESEAAVASGLNQAMQATALAQSEAKTFFTSYGDAVSAGHADTGAPGRMGDPDTSADAADSSG